MAARLFIYIFTRIKIAFSNRLGLGEQQMKCKWSVCLCDACMCLLDARLRATTTIIIVSGDLHRQCVYEIIISMCMRLAARSPYTQCHLARASTASMRCRSRCHSRIHSSLAVCPSQYNSLLGKSPTINLFICEFIFFGRIYVVFHRIFHFSILTRLFVWFFVRQSVAIRAGAVWSIFKSGFSYRRSVKNYYFVESVESLIVLLIFSSLN